MRRWVCALVLTAMIGGGVIVALGDVDQDVDLSAALELWGNVVRDTDSLGLRLTRVSARDEMKIGERLAEQVRAGVVQGAQGVTQDAEGATQSAQGVEQGVQNADSSDGKSRKRSPTAADKRGTKTGSAAARSPKRTTSGKASSSREASGTTKRASASKKPTAAKRGSK